MHVYSDDIQMDSTSQFAICVGKVNDSQRKVKKKEVPKSNNKCKKKSKGELIKELKLLKLNTNGSPKILSKRLEMHNNKKVMSNMCEKVMIDFYVVIDYEATCDKNQKNFDTNKQEIIEFPAVLLNCHTGEVEDEFQFYCRPVINPSLTDYCIKLTGITQSDVDNAPLFHEVLDSFNKWLQNKKLGSKYSFAIITDGTKDIGHFLKRQCVLSQIDFPEYCQYWINIRKAFSSFYRIADLNYLARCADDTVLTTMIKEIGYKFQGKAHSGLDDARNIAFIAQRLLEDGASLIFNEKLPEENDDKKEKSSFSTPISKAEFTYIRDTFKPNFPANTFSNSSLKSLDTNTVTKTVAKDGKACTKESTVKGVVKIPDIESNSAINETPTKSKAKKNHPPTKDTVKIPTKVNPTKNSSKVAVEKNPSPTVKGVVKIPDIESNSAINETPTKSKAKKNLPPTKDTVKIPTKVNPTKKSPKVAVGKNLVQREIVSTKDSLVKTSSKGMEAPTSRKTAIVIPAQSLVKNAPGKRSAKGSDTSAQNSKSADVLKQELLRAKKIFYTKCEFAPFKEVGQLKKQMEDLKKSLKAARSKDQSGVQEEKAVLVTELDLAKKKEFQVTQASESASNNCQSVKKNCSAKEENQLKSEVNQQSVVETKKKKSPSHSNRGFAALDGNHVIGNLASMKDEEERLFFEDFENLLTMKSKAMSEKMND